mgnify:CR=1 FL=1
MDYKREDAAAFSVEERIKNFNEFHTPLSKEEQQKQGAKRSLLFYLITLAYFPK